jgi:glutamate-5-semialdehyde dehydrogenase
MSIRDIARRAKQAAQKMAAVEGTAKDRALVQIAEVLRTNAHAIAAANRNDCQRSNQEALAAPLLKRLAFDADKVAVACRGIDALVGLPDPVGTTLSALELDADLRLYRVTCPIGVIGVIFESRPDALVQIATLCLKSGNAVLMKGGSEAAETNRLLADLIASAGESAGLPAGWMALLETRDEVTRMLALEDELDLIIPRGSNEFVRFIMDNTNVPVLGHADGICHLFVDSAADPGMAVRLAVDSKCQYVAVCNAVETILVHQDAAESVLPDLHAALLEQQVEIRGCERTCRRVEAKPATDADWQTEYLDLIVSVKIVAGLDAAIGHINRYGSGHTDVIVTGDRSRAERFMNRVDSADVFWNCSSRFSDGFRFGLGAEVGISTNKIHARGPVGMEGLLIYKWRLQGNGQCVADYSGPDGRPFTHRRLPV